jgi:hypothetical protein
MRHAISRYKPCEKVVKSFVIATLASDLRRDQCGFGSSQGDIDLLIECVLFVPMNVISTGHEIRGFLALTPI